MTVELGLTLAALGFLGSFVTGLLGGGGAGVLLPLLLYIPEWLGVGELDIKTAAALSITQVFFGTTSALFAHARHQTISASLAAIVSSGTLVASFATGTLSRFVGPSWLLLLFAVVVTSSSLITLVPPSRIDPITEGGALQFNRPLALTIGLFAGAIIGFLGAGNFMLIPLVRYLLSVPIKIAIGTTLVVAFFSSAGGLGGKLITGQVPFELAAAVVVGSIPGAQVGSWASRRLSGRVLRRLYTGLVSIIALGAWYDIFNVREL